MRVIPHLWNAKDVEMMVEVCGESASVKARLRLRAEGKRGQQHDMQDVLEPQAKKKARLEPRRGQKRGSTQPLPDVEEEVENTTL